MTLSHLLGENSPVHTALNKPEIRQKTFITRGDQYNSYLLTFENHSGTHADAPGHFLENGRTISQYNPNELIFNHPSILDIPKGQNELIEVQDIYKIDLDGVDCIFFRTEFEKYRENNPEIYLTQNPGISPEVIYFIRKNFPRIRCIGIDTISISSNKNPQMGREAHLNAFKDHKEFGEPLLLIEDLKLNKLTPNVNVKRVIVVPWQIKGIDSAPCTVLAEID